MSDRFFPLPIDSLFKWVFSEEREGKYLGFYKELIFTPRDSDLYKMYRYGKLLETPIGVAAGPHTQLAQNIIAAWLCGARYIELKTVQTLDEIEVTKPCIDMQDEGYNCEWSQELKIENSFDEYLNAWIIIHLLRFKFGWESKEPGFMFNMSAGYDFKGINKANVQWYLDKMNDCRMEKEQKLESLEKWFPEVSSLNIPDQISDNITLSTMHGCPPEEIEKICSYFIEERKLNTCLKLNPTLLGKENLSRILRGELGYDIAVPDEAFEHDLRYSDAVEIIISLQRKAARANVEFGLKLTNTLECLNIDKELPEKTLYASGRVLHPISVNLAALLQSDFTGELDISFSAGVDAFNAASILACNMKPVTVCSDLLKPGGYLRLVQYLEEIQASIEMSGKNNLDDYVRSTGQNNILSEAALHNLKNYASFVTKNKYYHKQTLPDKNIKTKRPLKEFDCIIAPCIESCSISQNVPEYMYYTSIKQYAEAYKTILLDNPLPNITGNVCDHLCQTKCTRINYDNPLLIRGVKRFLAENGDTYQANSSRKTRYKAAVIGAGPSGLTCAYFLALNGFEVNVYEGRSSAGGMVSGSIPLFRLDPTSISSDMDLIKSAGVELYFNQKINFALFSNLLQSNDFIYIAIGAQQSKKLNIPGEDSIGVIDQLKFLGAVRDRQEIRLGEQVAVIGGGLSAIDAARAAKRISHRDGMVKILYRRTKKEMPAGAEEINALLDEGIEIQELVNPLSILQLSDGSLLLNCIRMEPGEKDLTGRRTSTPVKGSESVMIFDNIITAIGQNVNLDFVPDKELIINPVTNETQIPNVFAGGDAVRGADSLINAMGDGKKAAQQMISRTIKESKRATGKTEHKLSPVEFQKKSAYRQFGVKLPEIDPGLRKGFELVHPVLDEESAVNEARRCLFCNDVCDVCVGVCPNLANISFNCEPAEIPVYEISHINGQVSFKSVYTFRIDQKRQIITIGDFCNECGNCNTFCPTSGAPYKTKPRFYLSKESYNAEQEGYHYLNGVLTYKEKGIVHSIFKDNMVLNYDSSFANIRFDIESLIIKQIKVNQQMSAPIQLYRAAEMCFLIRNIDTIPLLNTLLN